MKMNFAISWRTAGNRSTLRSTSTIIVRFSLAPVAIKLFAVSDLIFFRLISNQYPLAHTHVTDSTTVTAQILHRPCNSRLVILQPVDSTIQKAIIIAKVAHNHPSFLNVKPSNAQKVLLARAIETAGAEGITPKQLKLGL